MVQLLLSNANPHSVCTQAIVDVLTKTCRINADETIAYRTLLADMDFQHPLFRQAILHPSGGSYVYEYDDFNGLLHAAPLIYATLLQADNPLECVFKIKPSLDFMRLNKTHEMYFSMDGNKKAKATIDMEQLNAMVSHYHGFAFQYQDGLLLEQTVKACDLPDSVDGDLLYKANQNIVRRCMKTQDSSPYELRYMNARIGFGAFARSDIKKGAFITTYAGLKTVNEGGCTDYLFRCGHDVLQLCIDASHYGNISRFINHAPNTTQGLPGPLRGLALEANVLSKRYYLNGNNVILLFAKKHILSGEPFLMDYGPHYFLNHNALLFFKKNGDIVDSAHQKITDSRTQRRRAFAIFSHDGIKQAQWWWIRRSLMVLVGVFLLAFLGRFIH